MGYIGIRDQIAKLKSRTLGCFVIVWIVVHNVQEYPHPLWCDIILALPTMLVSRYGFMNAHHWWHNIE